MKGKILIIKTGHSEVFNESTHSEVVSLGDVLRCFYLLNHFSKQYVTWLASENCLELFERFQPNLNIIINFNGITLEDFEVIVNLEKDPEILNWISGHPKVFGFTKRNEILTVNFNSGERLSFEEALLSLEHKNSCFNTKLNKVLGIKDKHKKDEDKKLKGNIIGLNWKVGSKWPEKRLGSKFWKDLELELKKINYKVSWQEGFEDIKEYIEWINSCDYIITLDSLGLHLAKSLSKETVVLFGPTNPFHIPESSLIYKISHNQKNTLYYMEEVISFFRRKKESI